jgi:hypothetical protein
MSDAMDSATDDSLRGDLAAALGGAEEVIEQVDAVTTESEETAEQAEQRQRDERGRFAKKQAEEAAAADPNAQAVETAEATAAQEVAAQPQLKKPPQSWKPELKAHFDTLPPEVQDEILRRESDYSKGIQKYAEDAKVAQTFKPVVDQWAPYFNQLQVTPDQAFAHLMQTEYALRNGSPAQKQAMFAQLAKDYGIEFGGQSAESQGQVDPNLQHALSEVQRLSQYIQNMEYNKKQEAERQQQTEQAELNKRVEEFASKPDNPHFDSVRDDMARMLQAGYAESLEDAYEKACWARPDIRASLLKDQEAKRIQEKAQAANQAKAKAVSVTGSPSGAAVPVPGASIRDDLAAAFSGSGRL